MTYKPRFQSGPRLATPKPFHRSLGHPGAFGAILQRSPDRAS